MRDFLNVFLCLCDCAEEEKDFEREKSTDWHPVKVVNPKQQNYVLQWVKSGYAASEGWCSSEPIVFSSSDHLCHWQYLLSSLSLVIEC